MTTVHRHSSETRADGSPGTARSSPVGAVARYSAAAVRLSMGWVFLWAFFDKTFGLGHETASKDAWTNGGSPTKASSRSQPRDRSRTSTTASPARPGPTGSS
jgi:thiosulfate dehydrogenase [quinone] large subunit